MPNFMAQPVFRPQGPLSNISSTTLPNPQQVQLPVVPGQGQTPPSGMAAPGAMPSPTTLQNPQEQAFRQWVAENKMPFDANGAGGNYDMRGFWQALQQGHPGAHGAMQGFPPFNFPSQWALPGHPNFQLPQLGQGVGPGPQTGIAPVIAEPTPTPKVRA